MSVVVKTMIWYLVIGVHSFEVSHSRNDAFDKLWHRQRAISRSVTIQDGGLHLNSGLPIIYGIDFTRQCANRDDILFRDCKCLNGEQSETAADAE